jgi:uncharacterized membrane protein YraQ (UPF0718 family)
MDRAVHILTAIAASTWDVLVIAAPWLLAGLVLAGMIRAWLPDRVVARWLGGGGIGSVVRAAIIGTPLPLCSCGVVPAAIGLRRQGASKPATVSFLVATPENGADSIALTYALMGPVMAIARPVAAFIAAVTAGALTLILSRRDTDEKAATPESPTHDSAHDCCHHEPEHAAPTNACCHTDPEPAPKPCCHEEPTPHSCCHSTPPAATTPRGPVARLLDGIRYAFTRLLDDLAPWLAFGLVLAGAVTALAPPDVMAEWGRGPLAMIAMALIGVPIYVCATSYTPVGASLIIAGVSPGAVLVLLLAGPATNIGTIGIVKRELGTRALLAYLFGVVVVSIGAGLALDAIVEAADFSIAEHAAHAHDIFPAWLSITAAAILAICAIRPLRRAIARLLPSPSRNPT